MSDPITSSIRISPLPTTRARAAGCLSRAALASLLALTASDAAMAVNRERCRELFFELAKIQSEINEVSGEVPPPRHAPLSVGLGPLEEGITSLAEMEKQELARLEEALERLENYAFFLEMEKRAGRPAEGLDPSARAYLQMLGGELGPSFDSSWHRRQGEYVALLKVRVMDKFEELLGSKRNQSLNALYREKEIKEADLKAECPMKPPPLPRNESGRILITPTLIERCKLYECQESWFPEEFSQQDSREAENICHGVLPPDLTQGELDEYRKYRPEPNSPDSDQDWHMSDCIDAAIKLIGEYSAATPVEPPSSAPPPSVTAAQPAPSDPSAPVPPVVTPPQPETGPLPFDRKPSGAPIMTAALIERYLKARAGANAKESAYWRLGRFDTFGYTDVESRISVWLIHGETPRRFEFFTEAELNALESRRADIERVYY